MNTYLYQNVSLWLKYLDMEMKNKFVNHARNLFDRVCGLLPRVDQFWYKYAYMEEILGQYSKARAIFEKWMTWRPEREKSKVTVGCCGVSTQSFASKTCHHDSFGDKNVWQT